MRMTSRLSPAEAKFGVINLSLINSRHILHSFQPCGCPSNASVRVTTSVLVTGVTTCNQRASLRLNYY